MQLTQDKKNKITEVHNKALTLGDKNKMTIFDNIQGKRFDKFERKVLSQQGISIENENPILFLSFIAALGGWTLITNEKIYHKEPLENLSVVKLSNIKLVTVSKKVPDRLMTTITIKSQKDTITKMDDQLHLVKTILDILLERDTSIELVEAEKTEVVVENEHAQHPQQIRCLGCKAIISSNQNVCQYCRSPLK